MVYGIVFFFEDDVELGSATLNDDGIATLELTYLTAGVEDTITAEYEGSTDYAASTSDPLTLAVATIPTTTALVRIWSRKVVAARFQRAGVGRVKSGPHPEKGDAWARWKRAATTFPDRLSAIRRRPPRANR